VQDPIEVVQPDQLRALTMIVENLRGEIGVLKKFISEKDFTDELLASGGQSTMPPNMVGKAEFLSMKQIIGRQQLALGKIEQQLTETHKHRHDLERVEVYVRENLELLGKYIEENKNMTTQMLNKLSGRVNSKADFNFFEEFKAKVQEKILS
jgi:hypothetical protein